MLETIEFIACLIGAVGIFIYILLHLGLFATMFAVVIKQIVEEHERNRD